MIKNAIPSNGTDTALAFLWLASNSGLLTVDVEAPAP